MIVRCKGFTRNDWDNLKLESKKIAGKWISKKVKEKADLGFINKCIIKKLDSLCEQLGKQSETGFAELKDLKTLYFYNSVMHHLNDKKYSKKVRKATNGLTRYEETKQLKKYLKGEL
ncbi:MAG: hypothetical protein LBV51_04145 [Acholeplasmatales bacterium]|jgi:hypothetical protein|nr:hypothetical protein [Acholeplasmatales bacterium]